MKHATSITILATAALVLGSAAVAESPVVTRIRALVNAIDAGIQSKPGSETSVNLEGPDGVNRFVADQNADAVSIKHWGGTYGGVVKARASFGGEFETTEAHFYWSVNSSLVQKPLFAYMNKTYRDSNNRPKRTEEWRCYFENGKPSVFRIGARTVSPTDRRCKNIVRSMQNSILYITPGD